MDSLAGTLGCGLVQGTNPAQPMTLILKYKFEHGNYFLANQIRISDYLKWYRKYFLAHHIDVSAVFTKVR